MYTDKKRSASHLATASKLYTCMSLIKHIFFHESHHIPTRVLQQSAIERYVHTSQDQLISVILAFSRSWVKSSYTNAQLRAIAYTDKMCNASECVNRVLSSCNVKLKAKDVLQRYH